MIGNKKWTWLFALLMVVSLTLSACATPTPEVVEKVVEKVVTQVVKETVKETVIVAGTPQVIEKEVTKVVEKVVVATPEPISGVPVIILDGEPEMLHPIMSKATLCYTVLDEVNCFLARYDEDFNIIPGVATSWDFVDDTTVRFHIRKGVKFHNGEELTAEDVKFSIEAHLDPEHGSGDRALMEPIDYVEVEDDYTAVVHLKTPFAPLMDLLISETHGIIPRSVYETPGSAKSEPVGCGPFKFKEWRKNAYIELEKYEDYWEEGLPKTDGLKYTFLPEYNAAKASLLSKEGDVLQMLNLVDVPVLLRTDGIKLDTVLLMGFWYVGMDTEREPFNDVRVRQAVKYAMDRQQFLKSVLAGFGETAFIPVPKTSVYYVPEVEYEQDIDKAKALLAEAGYPDGFDMTLTVPKTPEEEPMGVVFQSQLKAIGINAELEVLDVPAYIEKIFKKVDFEMMICGDTAGPDPYPLLSYYLIDSSKNLWHYKNEVVDEAIKESSTKFDEQERKEILKIVYTTVVEEAPMVWIARGERVSAYGDYLGGFVKKPDLRYEFWNLYFVRPRK